MERRFYKNDSSKLEVGRLWALIRGHIDPYGTRTSDLDAVVSIRTLFGDSIDTFDHIRKDVHYMVEGPDEYEDDVVDFFNSSSNLTLLANDEPGSPLSLDDAEDHSGRMRIGGKLSPRPPDYLYAYTVNANDPISTVRSGGVTYLPAGTSAVVFETGFTFNGQDEVNDILRYWVSCAHHAPIMEIEQDDLEFLVSHYRQSGDEDLFRSKKSANHSRLISLFRDLRETVTAKEYQLTHAAFRRRRPGKSLDDALKEFAELEKEIGSFLSTAGNVAALSLPQTLSQLSKLHSQVLGMGMEGTRLSRIMRDLLIEATEVDSVGARVQELQARLDSEAEVQERTEEIRGSRRLMVAMQNYRVMTIPSAVDALQIQMSFMLVNSDQVTPDFQYKSRGGKTVQTVQESAFPHWVSGTLEIDNGVPDDAFLALRGGTSGARIGSYQFSEWSPIDDLVIYSPSVEKGTDDTWDDSNLFLSSAARALNVGDRSAVSRMSVATNFQMTPIPVESDLVPFYQYMGVFSTQMQVEFATTDREFLQELNGIPASLAAMAKQNSSIEMPFLVVRNPLANMVDLRECVIQGVEIKDEPDSTDTWVGTVTFGKYSSRRVRELDSAARRQGGIQNSESDIFDKLLIDGDGQRHRSALAFVMKSLNLLEEAPFTGAILSDMGGLDESAFIKFGQYTNALPDFEAAESTKADVQQLLLGLGVWTGDEGNNNDAVLSLDSMIGILLELIERGYQVIPVAEGDPRLGEKSPVGQNVAFPNRSQEAGRRRSIINSYSKSFPHRQRPRTSLGAYLRQHGDVVYNLRKALDRITRNAGLDIAADMQGAVPELRDAHGFTLIHPDGTSMGYGQAVLQEIGIPIMYHNLLLSREGFVTHDRTRGAEVLHNRAADQLTEMGYEFDERPVLTDIVMTVLPRAQRILDNFAIETLDLRDMDTDPVFGDNFSTFPDLRLPKFLDYPLLLTDHERKTGKTRSSYMSTDWYFSYDSVLSSGDRKYSQLEHTLSENVEFNRQLLASRYSHHQSEMENTRATIDFTVTKDLVQAASVARTLYVPIPQQAVLAKMKELHTGAPEWMKTGSGTLSLRLKGVHTLDAQAILSEAAKISRQLAAIDRTDLIPEAKADLDVMDTELKEKKGRLADILANITGKSAEEEWRQELKKLYSSRLDQEMSIEIPLAALSFDYTDQTFQAMPCLSDELRSYFLGLDSGLFSGQQYRDPLYIPNDDVGTDANTGGIFAEAYGNSGLMSDVNKPHLRGAHQRETGIASPEMMDIDRSRQRDDELNTRVYGFKRCYPTYSVLFYQEYDGDIQKVGSAYVASSVTELQVHHSKKNPVSVASLRIANPFNELFQPYVTEGGASYKPPLVVGMGVVIKLGYDSNVNGLETVFTGQITDLSYGREIDIVCQSWSVEFMYERGEQGFWDKDFDRVAHTGILDSFGGVIQPVLNIAVGSAGVSLATNLLSKARTGHTARFGKWAGAIHAKRGFNLARGAQFGASAYRLGRTAYGLGRMASVGRSLVWGARAVGVGNIWNPMGLVLLALSLGADFIVGRWINKKLGEAARSLSLQGEKGNADWKRLNTKIHTIEQYLVQHILLDIRISHFHTPYYLGFSFVAPKNENVFMPTVPELYEGIGDMLVASAAEVEASRVEKDSRDSDTYKNTHERIHGTLTRRHSGLVGLEFDYLFKNMTAWEAMVNLAWRYPHLEIACRPYDYRSTLFIGRPDRYYRHTERRDEAWREWLDKAGVSRSRGLQKVREDLNVLKENFLLDAMSYALPGKMDRDQTRKALGRLRTNFSGPDTISVLNVPLLGNAGKLIDMLSTGINRMVAIRAYSLADVVDFSLHSVSARLIQIQRYMDLRDQFKDPLSKSLLRILGEEFGSREGLFPLSEARVLDELREGFLDMRSKIAKKKELLESSPHLRPFRRYHTVSSNVLDKNLIRNSVMTSDDDMYNQVTIAVMDSFRDVGKEGDKTPKNWHYVDVVADRAIPAHERKTLNVQCKTTSDLEVAANVGTSILKQSVSNMYRGEAIVLGNAHAFPYDRMVMSDPYNSMYGVCEVAAVNHRFNRSGGFVTSYEPGCVVYAKDNVGYLNWINSKSRALLSHWCKVIGVGAASGGLLFGGALASTAIIGGAGAGVLGSVSTSHLVTEILGEWSGQKRLSPLVICPMIQHGRFMLAGVNGVRWDLLQDLVDDNGVNRRLRDYLRLMKTGWSDFFRNRSGAGLMNWGSFSGATDIEAQNLLNTFRFMSQSGEELNRRLLGETL